MTQGYRHHKLSKTFAMFLGSFSELTLVNRFNHTSGMTAVILNDRPKSVRNCCVIEVFGGVFFVVFLFFCGCWGFCHRTESDLCLFLFCTYLVIKSFISEYVSEGISRSVFTVI